MKDADKSAKAWRVVEKSIWPGEATDEELSLATSFLGRVLAMLHECPQEYKLIVYDMRRKLEILQSFRKARANSD